MDAVEPTAQKLRASSVSVYVNVMLLSIKIVVGVLTGSLGILAEVAHSLLDLAASGSAYLGIKSANVPPDAEHLYGHEKYEPLSSLVQTALLAITCIWIFYEAGLRLAHGFEIATGNILYYGIVVMAVAIFVDTTTSRYLFINAKRYHSSALEADAYHFSTDIYSSTAVLIGLIASRFGYQVVDPIAAILVAVIMLSTSIKLGKRSISVLVDGAPPKETIEKINEVLTESAGIVSYHDLRARQVGGNIFVDVSIHVSPDLSLDDAHEIADKLEIKLREKIATVKEVIVHIEPEARQ
jgi:cation diffusion facilitator family transporter